MSLSFHWPLLCGSLPRSLVSPDTKHRLMPVGNHCRKVLVLNTLLFSLWILEPFYVCFSVLLAPIPLGTEGKDSEKGKLCR